MEEIWKDIPGWEGYYQASNYGRIRGIDRWVVGKDGRMFHIKPSIRKPHETTTCDYLAVVLSKERRFTNHMVHILVCSAFHGKREGKLEVNHKNGNKHDNRSENLEWVTRKENYYHAIVNHLKHDSGEENSRAKLTNQQARDVRARHSNGESYASIARDYNCTGNTISLICKHKTYKNA